jgi:peptidoglycan hydrolase-like protein with peptidoglycan-binding domain
VENKPVKPPDRASSEPPPESPKTAQAVKVRTVRVATVGETPPEEGDTDTVRAVQTELNRLGYGPLVADGVMRPTARAAIMAFEHEHRLALTGQATQGLLKLLLFGAPAATGAAAPAEAPSPQAQGMIRQVQRMLADRGYRPGAIDGRLSAETVAAIRTFEADQGLVPKGRISAVVLERLEGGLGGGGRHREP